MERGSERFQEKDNTEETKEDKFKKLSEKLANDAFDKPLIV